MRAQYSAITRRVADVERRKRPERTPTGFPGTGAEIAGEAAEARVVAPGFAVGEAGDPCPHDAVEVRLRARPVRPEEAGDAVTRTDQGRTRTVPPRASPTSSTAGSARMSPSRIAGTPVVEGEDCRGRVEVAVGDGQAFGDRGHDRGRR